MNLRPDDTRRTVATPRQAEILDLIASGLSDKEIGHRLGLSTRTIRTHLEIYYRRSRQHNRIGALRAYRDSQELDDGVDDGDGDDDGPAPRQ